MSDEADPLDQERLAYQKAKDFWKNLTKSLENYAKEAEDMKKFVMYDRIPRD